MPVTEVSSTKVVPSTTGVPTRTSGEISLFLTAAVLAQSVERVTAEREVAGSIPGTGPILRVLK